MNFGNYCLLGLTAFFILLTLIFLILFIKNRNKYNSVFIYSCIVSLLLIVRFIYGILNPPNNNFGERAVNYLYQFDTLADVQENDEKLKELCTEEAYEKLTATDKDKALRTYLKFKGDKTSVKIFREYQTNEGGYVCYRLDNKHLTSSRKFIFIYDIKNGLIDNPREMECIDFCS